jgi:hypothetical protein
MAALEANHQIKELSSTSFKLSSNKLLTLVSKLSLVEIKNLDNSSILDNLS